MTIDYKNAGVDIKKGENLVDWLSKEAGTEPNFRDSKDGDSEDREISSGYGGKGPHGACVLEGIGGFASIFRLDVSGIKEPCLVSATDGVGTKLKLAVELGQYSGLGQDLVAMCANDLICTGARPLFFLDYFSTSSLDLDQAKTFLKSVRQACHKSQMALVGGETAEMPGLYQPGDFDCAGFAVGVVDRQKILGANRVKEGMLAIGVSSSGFHSNGFSLLRKLYSSPEDLRDYGKRLLTPTHLYVDLVLDILKQRNVAAIAHITGGGIHNLERVLPKGLGLKLKVWEFPEIFKETMSRADLSKQEMLKTFNCGVGLVLIASADQNPGILSQIEDYGFQSHDLGVLESIDQPEQPIIFMDKK